MCSNCSGNYAGDYDNPEGTPSGEDSGAEAERDTACSGVAGDHDAGGGSGAATDWGEAGACGDASAQPQPGSQVRDICHKIRHPALQPALEEDGWEVLVSEDRIIEIHFLSAPVWDAWPGRWPTDIERARLNQHSPSWSANSYQTLYESLINSFPASTGPSSIRLLYLGLGALTAAFVAVWMLLN